MDGDHDALYLNIFVATVRARLLPYSQDQQQTPEHPNLEPGNPYPMDGHCFEQCDCGSVNPCGEYIFNHSGAEVEGRTFRHWFINE
eukprot:COSAG02_NODE_253_length_26942_cov_80.561152_4_plen_86_part_00